MTNKGKTKTAVEQEELRLKETQGQRPIPKEALVIKTVENLIKEKNDNTMYNGNVIKQLLLDKKVTNKELLRYLGTEANASLAQIVNGNPTVKRLEKVADFFGVSMDVFFEREKPFKAYSSAHGDNEQQYKEKIELLERLLEEKDKRILLLEQMNQLVNPTESRTDLGQTI